MRTPVLEAMRALPDVLAYRSRLPAPLIAGRLADASVVTAMDEHPDDQWR